MSPSSYTYTVIRHNNTDEPGLSAPLATYDECIRLTDCITRAIESENIDSPGKYNVITSCNGTVIEVYGPVTVALTGLTVVLPF